MTAEPVKEPPKRIYDKGVDRYRHVGNKDEPEILLVDGSPRHFLGKCPRGISVSQKTALLNEAIPDDNGDREIDFDKRLYVVHEGAIYRAETTNWGVSYHAYPYAGKLGKTMIAVLGAMAEQKDCRKEFDKWVAKHIELHGK